MTYKEGKLSRIIRTITIGWDYFTVFTLVMFGISFLSPKKTIPWAIMVFAFGLLFLFLTTWKYLVGPRLKRDPKKKVRKIRLINFFYTLVKLIIILLPLLTLNPNWTVDFQYPKLTTALSLVYLGLTIILQIVLFFLRKLVKKIQKEMKKSEEEKK